MSAALLEKNVQLWLFWTLLCFVIMIYINVINALLVINAL